MSIKDVCGAIKGRINNISEDDLKHAEDAVASWINLLHSFDEIKDRNARLTSLIKDITSEIFKEIHVAIFLSVSGNYSAACVLSRGCIEKSIYILYFIDHPMTAFDWAENGTDLSFSAITEAMSVSNYFELATGSPVGPEIDPPKILSKVRTVYRRYSETVHGKYKFMEGQATEDELRREYYKSIKDAATALRTLMNVRLMG